MKLKIPFRFWIFAAGLIPGQLAIELARQHGWGIGPRLAVCVVATMVAQALFLFIYRRIRP